MGAHDGSQYPPGPPHGPGHQAPTAPSWTPQAPPARGKEHVTRLTIATIAAGAGIVIGYGLFSGGPSVRPAASVQPMATVTKTVRPSATPTPKPIRSEPTRRDLSISIKELKRSCFGSAGCNVTFRIKPKVLTEDPFKAGTTYEVTYKMIGGTEPKTGTFTLTDGVATVDESDLLTVRSSTTKLRASVTSIEALN